MIWQLLVYSGSIATNLQIGETHFANITHGCAIGETIKNKQKQTKNDTKNT